jgi:lipid-A-disaccharide synthase
VEPETIPQMARYLDLMLCIFPFEAELYNKSGLRTVFVGHPMLETLKHKRLNGERNANLIGLFPGSRMREIRKILPSWCVRQNESRRRSRIFASKSPRRRRDSRVKSSGCSSARVCRRILCGSRWAKPPRRCNARRWASSRPALRRSRRRTFRMPFVVVYRVAWLTYFAAWMVVKVKHVGMPNVLARREIVPEYIQHRARPAAVAGAVTRLLEQPNERETMVTEFDRVVAQLGEGAASAQAAKVVLSAIGS